MKVHDHLASAVEIFHHVKMGLKERFPFLFEMIKKIQDIAKKCLKFVWEKTCLLTCRVKVFLENVKDKATQEMKRVFLKVPSRASFLDFRHVGPIMELNMEETKTNQYRLEGIKVMTSLLKGVKNDQTPTPFINSTGAKLNLPGQFARDIERFDYTFHERPSEQRLQFLAVTNLMSPVAASNKRKLERKDKSFLLCQKLMSRYQEPRFSNLGSLLTHASLGDFAIHLHNTLRMPLSLEKCAWHIWEERHLQIRIVIDSYYRFMEPTGTTKGYLTARRVMRVALAELDKDWKSLAQSNQLAECSIEDVYSHIWQTHQQAQKDLQERIDRKPETPARIPKVARRSPSRKSPEKS